MHHAASPHESPATVDMPKQHGLPHLHPLTSPKDTPRGPHIRVCTLNAVTGLESTVVFVLGTHRLWEAEGSLGEEERAEQRKRRAQSALLTPDP